MGVHVQGGDEALQAMCEGFDSLYLHVNKPQPNTDAGRFCKYKKIDKALRPIGNMCGEMYQWEWNGLYYWCPVHDGPNSRGR